MEKEENFIFYGSWRKTLYGLVGFAGKDVAKETLWQIMEFGTTGEFTTDNENILNFVNGTCADLIQNAKRRRDDSLNNGKKGGRPRTVDNDTVLEFHRQGLSNQEIATQLGCSIKTVQRALIDYDEI